MCEAAKDRLSIENIRFIATVPKKNGAKGVSILPILVRDLKALEKGVLMFCEKDKQCVLVIAPVLWIGADTPCHSEICGLSGPTSLYPCRKCYVCIHRLKDSLPDKEYCTDPHKRRTRKHYVLANSMSDRTTIIPDAPTDGCNLSVEDLSFQDRSTGSLLELDAFDPSSGTPVEVIHTILLGIGKYMVIHLMNGILKSKKDIIQRLKTCLDGYKCSTGLSRKFTRNINHSGSYVGRDFKVLLQILPVILVTDFSNEPILDRIKPCFVELGRLCSLVFVREVTSGFDDYLVEVDLSVRRLLGQLHNYDTFKRAEVKENNKTAKIKKKYTAFCTKRKIHNLTHLKYDIRRFGTALQFETEKGEQFNKHIREHLFHTNHKNTSRDVCLKLAKQAALQYVMDGGSWLNENGQRERPGCGIAAFLQGKSEKKFRFSFFGGSRDFTSNNDTGDRDEERIKNNSFGAFIFYQ
ncbi:hypothetical protein J3Q64DRAFT_1194702 [Phycomyces blakesleeanus]|uniref:Uncharacterized protein n=2 Tax=Phycomyces blakesleeanus TaxID=4837 RepID=A0A162QAH8_PHYB8|nr:hypothetical protein PHYBLDRAFT_138984 [Phycomyces blakesleeanus NRRL 1555(-)]OAD81436.1 hypothetical protein PHYBLDRAFT_138984 [Phycomyces blakesleeanus NRRL 1555(-)]|eukprot:XP_018299476.1 hypothetical protein PHYBLDRAFT_138984 [Phycomyces blakesleeanus NRRL 1555(-)]